MKSASYAFKRAMAAGAPLLCYADITLANGTKLPFGPDNDFMVDGNSISDGSGSSGFPLGAAVAKTVTINIDNSDDRYSSYDFYMARMTVWTGIDLGDGTTERIREGTYTVIDAITPGETLEIDAINDMYKADIAYVPSVVLPTDLITILRDICSQCGLLLGSPSFKNQDYRVNELPTGTTCRTVIGYIAQIAGGNAYCDVNNRLIIRPYDLSVFETLTVVDGRSHDETVSDTVDGGDFNDATAAQIDGGAFGEGEGYHSLYDWTSLTVATDDVVITGITTTISSDDGDVDYLYGVEGYTLAIDNPLIKGNERDAVNRIGAVLVGITARPFEGESVAYALAEIMDPCIVWDAKSNMYLSFLTDIDYSYGGSTRLKNSTEPPLRNQSEYYSNVTEAYRRARQEAAKQKAEWEKAMEDLSNRLENSSGLFTTIDKQADGSSIFYMHDKPNLSESMIIWKQTAEAWGVSTDGGETWNAGMTVDGDVIARILNTIGINADWIRTGEIRSVNFKEGKSGILYDLNNSKITSYKDDETTLSDGTTRIFSTKMEVSNSQILIESQVEDIDVASYYYRIIANRYGFHAKCTLDGRTFEVSMQAPGIRFSADGKQIFSMNSTNGEISVGVMSLNVDHLVVDGITTKTGRAEFSDGTYLEYKNGILIGGNTAEGGAI